MTKVTRKVRKHLSEVKKEALKQMLTLATGGFGLVAALAWNELIKKLIDEYLQPFFGGNSGIISLFVYAILITLLAVFVTYSLTKIVRKR